MSEVNLKSSDQLGLPFVKTGSVDILLEIEYSDIAIAT